MMVSMSEEWCAVVGFEGYYEVSNQGRVRSVPRVTVRSNGWPMTVRGRILKPSLDPQTDYLKVGLQRDGVWTTTSVHRLVALHWCERPPGKDYVLHGPAGNKVNAAWNLRWGTPVENAADRKEFGAEYPPPRDTCDAGHDFTEDNIYRPPKHPNVRQCRECQRQRVREYRQRLREYRQRKNAKI